MLHRESFRWFELEHSSQEVFQVIAKVYDLIEDFPVNVGFVFGEQSVVFIFTNCFFEGLALGHHEEKNNGGSEHISTFTGVSFENVLFWWHVAERTFIFVKNIGFIFTLEIGGKTKISKFEVEIFIYQNIFWFQISVADFCIVVHVVQGIKELDEIISRDIFI